MDLHYSLGGRIARDVVRTRGGRATAQVHRHDAMGNRLETTLPDGRVLRYNLYGSGHVDGSSGRRVAMDVSPKGSCESATASSCSISGSVTAV